MRIVAPQWPRERIIVQEVAERNLPRFGSLAEAEAWLDEATTLAQLRQKFKVILAMVLMEAMRRR